MDSALFGHMASFSPKDSFVAFNLESLVELAKFYPEDFNSEKLNDLGHELVTYIDNVRADERFANLDGIADASKMHPLFQALCLIICSEILPYSNKTAVSDAVFSKVSPLAIFAGNKIGEKYHVILG